ncbi:MAG: glycosyltransferase family 2 protein [Candidatus Omnitrophica bacterium]|nr:glycosyltransferase family 2 protein [Candidatus Omnitrophota bacterium]
MKENRICLSIIIPARNEEEAITSTIANLLKHIDTRTTEIIVVDDHSTDDTSRVIEVISQNNPLVRLVKNVSEPGFANALLTGFNHARGEYVLPVMADGCDAPETIPLMLEKAESGYDLVCGCRYMKGSGKYGGPFLQSFFSKFVCLTLHYIAGISTRDVSNAFKLYRRRMLKNVNLKEKGFAVSMEAALKFHFNEYKICDVPTVWYGRKKGKSKFRLTRTLSYVKLYLQTLGRRWKK